MTLLTPYPKLSDDFEKWMGKTVPRMYTYGLTDKCSEAVQYLCLLFYAQSVGYKISVVATWSVYSEANQLGTGGFDTFPAAFNHFAQIREKELNNLK